MNKLTSIEILNKLKIEFNKTDITYMTKLNKIRRKSKYTLIGALHKKWKNRIRAVGIIIAQQNPHFTSINKSISTTLTIPNTSTTTIFVQIHLLALHIFNTKPQKQKPKNTQIIEKQSFLKLKQE